MLPRNVLRPTPEDWQPAWGDRVVPAANRNRALEIGQRLDSSAVGAAIVELGPGMCAGPLHYHLFEEELFYVLEGEITVRELAPGAERYVEYPLRAGEIVVYPPGTGLAHHSHNRSDRPARYLCLSNERVAGEVAVFPDSGKTLIRAIGQIGVFGVPGAAEAHVAAARARADARGVDRLGVAERPTRVQGPDTGPERDLGDGVFGRPLARIAGATRVFVNVDRLTPGASSSPLHWHTADEELLLVLQGTPTLRQVREGGEERAILQPGDAVSWKAGDEVAHQVLCEGPDEVVILVVGTSREDDVTVFPERGVVTVRALGRTGSLVPLPYWTGEGG